MCIRDRDWVERTSLLRPKSGRNPTSAAKGGVWPLSRKVQLPPPRNTHSFHPLGPRVKYDAADFTEFAMSVEISHVPSPKIGRWPAKREYAVYYLYLSPRPGASHTIHCIWSIGGPWCGGLNGIRLLGRKRSRCMSKNELRGPLEQYFTISCGYAFETMIEPYRAFPLV